MELPKEYQRRALEIVRQLKEAEEEAEEHPELRRDPATGDRYCVHGTNVGNSYGADLMCGACEDGVTHYEFALGRAYQAWMRDRVTFKRRLHEVVMDFHVKFAVQEGPAFTSKDLLGVYMEILSLGSE